MNALSAPVQTVLLLIASNVFMTFAWYGHLKNLADKPWFTAALITLAVFAPFAMLCMDQPVKLDFVWAGLCMLGAVYFIFRG